MITLRVRNVQAALRAALEMAQDGLLVRERWSRNGAVLAPTVPVTTVYDRPRERVLFWPERDANPFFHALEALWMLAGRNTLHALTPYVARMADFSDDGETLHGAYGHRWRRHFGLDQIVHVCEALDSNPEDRRQVIQMWDPAVDLLRRWGKDLPCNLTATVQINGNGGVDMVVFQRSGDALWGVYGANAVHFSVLQEHIANELGRQVGELTQVTVNWHFYLGAPYERARALLRREPYCPYADGAARVYDEDPYAELAAAHAAYRSQPKPAAFAAARAELAALPADMDWRRAAEEWIGRREARWKKGRRT